MSIRGRELKNGMSSWEVRLWFAGKPITINAGHSKTDKKALALEAQIKREIAAGTYVHRSERRKVLTVRRWLDEYFAARTNRTRETDVDIVSRHALSAEWFAEMPLRAVRPRDVLRLVDSVRSARTQAQARGERGFGEKSLSILYGLLHGAFARALVEELISDNPFGLARKEAKIKTKTPGSKKRLPYPREDVHRVLHHPEVSPDERTLAALAFYTGMREGEICGRRWRDWLRAWEPRTALLVHSQYLDQPLKTDDGDDVHPRRVPVHPDVELLLVDWWNHGFELVHRRRPTLDDFIVPQRSRKKQAQDELTAHTKSSAYKAFRRALAKAGVQNRSLHSTRHTFISIAVSNGAEKHVVERVTHNASGAVIDNYFTPEWSALCKAVDCFTLEPDGAPVRRLAGPAEPRVEPSASPADVAAALVGAFSATAWDCPLTPYEIAAAIAPTWTETWTAIETAGLQKLQRLDSNQGPGG